MSTAPLIDLEGGTALNDFPTDKTMERFKYGEYTAAYETIPDDDSQIPAALQEMKKNFRDGKTKNVDFRIAQLTKLMNALQANIEPLKEALIKDLGRNPFGAFIEVNGTILHLKSICKELKHWAKDTQVDTPFPVGPGSSYIKYEPLGVVCVMGAWNFPVTTLLGPVAYVMCAGNSVVLKPSELAPTVSKEIDRIVKEALDQRYYRVQQGKTKVAVTLNAQKFDMFVFTGSTQKGRLVAGAAAKNLVPCVLELGGKSPCIVDQSANCNWAAKKILFGKTFNTGQICIAPDYAMVHESKVDELLKEMKTHMKEGYSDNANDEAGKIINEFHYKRLCGYFADHGGKVVLGNPNAHQDFNLQPSVILNPDKESPVMQDEIFGPILPMLVYKDFSEVIDFILEREKPLAAYFFGNIKSNNFKTFEREVSTGAIATNDVVMQVSNDHLPFGGVGASGYGRYHGVAGFLQFSNPKSCLVKQPADYFPYNASVPPMTPEKAAKLMGQMKDIPPTQRQLRNMLIKCVLFIVFVVLAIVFRKEIMGLFSGNSDDQA